MLSGGFTFIRCEPGVLLFMHDGFGPWFDWYLETHYIHQRALTQ